MVPASAGMAYTPEQMLMQESGMLPHYGAGGKIAGMVEHFLPLAEREANKAKFLSESIVKNPAYHGTQGDFNEFKSGPRNRVVKGIYFAENPQTANIFAGQGQGANVMPVHLRMQNPATEMDMGRILDALPYEAKRTAAQRTAQLKKAGHDGVIVNNNAEGQSGNNYYIAFEPTQIKSAIGNRGTYDLNDPDINHAEGGRIDNLSPADMEAALIYNNHTPPKFHFAEGKSTTLTGNSPQDLVSWNASVPHTIPKIDRPKENEIISYLKSRLPESVKNVAKKASDVTSKAIHGFGPTLSGLEYLQARDAAKHGNADEAAKHIYGAATNFFGPISAQIAPSYEDILELGRHAMGNDFHDFASKLKDIGVNTLTAGGINNLNAEESINKNQNYVSPYTGLMLPSMQNDAAQGMANLRSQPGIQRQIYRQENPLKSFDVADRPTDIEPGSPYNYAFHEATQPTLTNNR